MTIVTGGAAILATIAISFWKTAVDTTNCVTVEGYYCICSNEYGIETYNGKITEFRHNCVHVLLNPLMPKRSPFDE